MIISVSRESKPKDLCSKSDCDNEATRTVQVLNTKSGQTGTLNCCDTCYKILESKQVN